MDVALSFSKCDTDYDDDQTPFLFVFSILNYNGFKGFRVDDSRWSVYPQEQEYLLMEGFQIFVLDV